MIFKILPIRTYLINNILECLAATFLVHVVRQDIQEALPSALGHSNAVTEIPFHLGDGHVTPLLATLDVEIEFFVFIPGRLLVPVMSSKGLFYLT